MFNSIFQEGIDYNIVQQNYLLNKIYIKFIYVGYFCLLPVLNSITMVLDHLILSV